MILKRLHKMLLRAVLGTLFCAALAGVSGEFGCSSGASAPPVSLPAPVSGRLTVTSPDEDGVALVIGDEGAVPADSLVHVVNESRTSASLIDFSAVIAALDPFPSAEAQITLPETCRRSFHGCAIADADGSFEIEINASEEDSIVVGILDQATGTTISERTRHPVPRNVRFFVRPVIALGLLNNPPTSDRRLYALMGASLEDANGLVSVVDLSTNTRNVVSFAGPRPARMAVDTATRQAAILDTVDETVAKVDLAVNNFNTPTSIPSAASRDLALNEAGNRLFITTASAGAPLRRIDFTTMTPDGGLNDVNLQAFIPGITNVDTRGVDVISYTTSATFDLLTFVGSYDVGGTATPAIGLVDATTMNLLALTPLPAGAVPLEAAFFVMKDKILVTDPANDQILIYTFATDHPGGVTTTLTLQGTVPDPSDFILNPRSIAVYPAGAYAFITARNGSETRPDSVLTMDLNAETLLRLRPVGHNPTDAVFDELEEDLFVSTLKTRAVTVWTLPELLP